MSTENSSLHTDLHLKGTMDLLERMNQEDMKVPMAIQNALPQIEQVVSLVEQSFKNGGRLFYIGAGTSGRLGVVDASECPPTFGVDHGMVIGLIAGGDSAIRKAVEFAEDDLEQGWKDLCEYGINSKDVLIGIAASGKTPYVIGAIETAKANGVKTACVVCNDNSPIAAKVDYPIEVVVGPEFLTGSTRLKAGSAQKLVLNMITTVSMIRIGKVKGNKMVDMQLSNNKLIDRGTKMVMDELGLNYEEANQLLLEKGNVRDAIESFSQE